MYHGDAVRAEVDQCFCADHAARDAMEREGADDIEDLGDPPAAVGLAWLAEVKRPLRGCGWAARRAGGVFHVCLVRRAKVMLGGDLRWFGLC